VGTVGYRVQMESDITTVSRLRLVTGLRGGHQNDTFVAVHVQLI
jgi:hypothetical protein